MMYYQELTLIEQSEISNYFLWSKIYTQLHLAFVEIKDADGNVPVGIAFPQYLYEPKTEKYKAKAALGIKLRCFADSEDILQKLDIQKWLSRLTDYVHITGIRAVPDQKVKQYAIYKRKQFKTNQVKLALNHMKVHPEVSFDDAMIAGKNKMKFSDLPYLQLKSLSSEHFFKIFIEKEIVDKSQAGKFSTYGLSQTTTLPEF